MVEAQRYFAAPGPNKLLSWRELGFSYPKEIVSRKRKQAIFGGDVARIQALFAGYGIAVPSNLIDDLVILGRADFKNVLEHMGSKYSERYAGFCDPNSNAAIISYSKLETKARENGVSIEDALRYAGVHELLHGREVCERWIPVSSEADPRIIWRRHGILTQRPNYRDNSEYYVAGGMEMFGEGVTTYLTTGITGLDNLPIRMKVYPHEVEVVRYLIDDIGFDPLFLAQYSKNGLRDLYREMTKVVSPYALQLVFTKMGEAYYAQPEEEEGMVTQLDYSAVFQALGYSLDPLSREPLPPIRLYK